jgi:hypothetical protein
MGTSGFTTEETRDCNEDDRLDLLNVLGKTIIEGGIMVILDEYYLKLVSRDPSEMTKL